MVFVAVMTGVVAMLGALAIFGSGAKWKKVHSDQQAHVELLQQFGMVTRKIGPLLGGQGCVEACVTAFDDQREKRFQTGIDLMTKAREACRPPNDRNSPECITAIKNVQNLDQKVIDDCTEGGDVCTLKVTDKIGEEEEKVCIPQACHNETGSEGKVKTTIQDTVNDAGNRYKGCSDFDCTFVFECSV